MYLVQVFAYNIVAPLGCSVCVLGCCEGSRAQCSRLAVVVSIASFLVKDLKDFMCLACEITNVDAHK